MPAPAFNKRTGVIRLYHLPSCHELAKASLTLAIKRRPCANRYTLCLNPSKIYLV